jgi:hypothetical protein
MELEKQACDRLVSKFEAKGVKFKLFLSERYMGRVKGGEMDEMDG